MYFEKVIVTPELAKEWLTLVPEFQRTIRKTHVKALARDISAGAWRLTHQALAFSNGQLIDGQHRLHAVVAADKAIEVMVASDTPIDSFPVIDRHNGRRIGDALRISTHKVALISQLSSLQTANRQYLKASAHFTSVVYASAREAVDVCEGFITSGLITSPMAGALAFAYPVNSDAIEGFANSVRTGAELSEGSPALALRNYMIRSKSLTTRGEVRIQAVLNALEAHLAGRRLLQLKCGISGYVAIAGRRRRAGILPTPTTEAIENMQKHSEAQHLKANRFSMAAE